MSKVRPLFRSFIQGGLECSTHLNRHGKRLDLLASTRHDCFAGEDYRRLVEFGIRTLRTTVRWYLIEKTPGEYDFSSLDRLLHAAQTAGVEVVPDLLHFGVPDHIDVFSRDFPGRFADFTFAIARYLQRAGWRSRLITPVNEISFHSWAGGEVAAISPLCTGRGDELKRNLVRAAVAVSEVLKSEFPEVRLIAPEPAIHIVGNPEIPGDEEEAIRYTLAYFEAWDMLSGRLKPELGGAPEFLDVIGVNFYWRNEWEHNSGPLNRRDPRWRPFSRILQDIWERYKRPMFVSETGTEDGYRAEWFEYICDEVAVALNRGLPIHGICLYPIINHPGWDDDRHCQNGLFDYANESGHREVYQPLAEAILRQQARFSRLFAANYGTEQNRPDMPLPSAVGIRFSAPAALDEPLCS